MWRIPSRRDGAAIRLRAAKRIASRRRTMPDRSPTTLLSAALVSVLMTMPLANIARAAEGPKYPTNWTGEWTRVVHPDIEVEGAVFQGGFDQNRRWGPDQQAPLTPEYQ